MVKIYDVSTNRTIRRSGRTKKTNYQNTSTDPIILDGTNSPKQQKGKSVSIESSEVKKTPSTLIKRKKRAATNKTITFSDSSFIGVQKTNKKKTITGESSLRVYQSRNKLKGTNDQSKTVIQDEKAKLKGTEQTVNTRKTGKRRKRQIEEDVVGGLEKKHKGRIPKPGISINNRCTPHQLTICIESLTEAQTSAVGDMGFGQLLSLAADTLPGRLGKYVVDQFNESEMIIHVENGGLKIDRECIHVLLGVPNEGIELDTLDKKDELDPLIAAWKERYGPPKTQISATDLCRSIQKSHGDNSFYFKLDFLMLFLTTMVECHKNGKCVEKILYYLTGEVELEKFNWCAYIVKALQRCKKNWHTTNLGSPFTGPLAILTLIYADGLECKAFEVDKEIPAIEFWTSQRLSVREKYEIKNGGFGTGRIIGYSMPTCTRSPAVLRNQKVTGLSLKRKIEGKSRDTKESKIVRNILDHAASSVKSQKKLGYDLAELLVQLSKLDQMYEILEEYKERFETRFGEIFYQHRQNPQVVSMKKFYARMLDSRPKWLDEDDQTGDGKDNGVGKIVKELESLYSEDKSDDEMLLSEKMKKIAAARKGESKGNVTVNSVGSSKRTEPDETGLKVTGTVETHKEGIEIGTIGTEGVPKGLDDTETVAKVDIGAVSELETVELHKADVETDKVNEDYSTEDEDDDHSGSSETEDASSESADEGELCKNMTKGVKQPGTNETVNDVVNEELLNNVYEEKMKISHPSSKTSSLKTEDTIPDVPTVDGVDGTRQQKLKDSGNTDKVVDGKSLEESKGQSLINQITPLTGKDITPPSFSFGLTQELENNVFDDQTVKTVDTCLPESTVGNKRQYPKRDKGLSKFAKSPFMIREVEIDKSFTKAEDKLWGQLFPDEGKGAKHKAKAECSKDGSNNSEGGNVCDWEHAYINSRGVVCEMKELRTLYMGTKVSHRVIDTWAEVLNHYEEYRAQEHSRRLFCTTNLILDWMLSPVSEDDLTRVTAFTTNMIDSLMIPPDQLDLRNFGLVFVPIIEDERVYLVVFDLKNPEISLIDSRHGGKSQVKLVWDEDYYEKSTPYKVKEVFYQYLVMRKHPKAKEFEHLSVNRVHVDHATKQTVVDNGVYVMRHMEMFMGKEEPFVCGFASNPAKKKSQLNALRKKYAIKILLSENNKLRGKVIEAVDGV